MNDIHENNESHGNDDSQENPHGIGDLLGVAAERAVPVVRALPDDRLEAATPCAEYDVKALVNHVFQVMEQFQRLAAKQDSDFTQSAADRVAEGPTGVSGSVRRPGSWWRPGRRRVPRRGRPGR